jgi:superfamily II DNA/RNA helicase
MNFAELGLSPNLVKAVEDKGYMEPTQVQAQAIPAALAGGDLLVSSQTGSGKTAAFILPSLERLSQPATQPGSGPRILVLAPTRELAQQVLKAAQDYGREVRRFRTASIVGGMPYGLQLKALSRPVDLVVATPGRLIDHLERGRIDLSRVETLILDEADRMLDMGFVDDINAIVARTPAERQTMLFSATLEGVVGRLAARVTRNARRIEITPPPAARLHITQSLLFADDLSHKTRLLDHLLRDAALDQAVVFTATKRTAEEISTVLREQGFAAAALHGDMTQGNRMRTLRQMRDGRMRILVATDVAARGIDVPTISHVINFDLPRQAEDYVHRIGRTGRAGREGTAVTLAGHSERHLVRAIERYTDQSIAVGVIPGLEPTARPRREPGAAHRPSGPRSGAPRNGAPNRGNGGGWNSSGKPWGSKSGSGQGRRGDGQGKAWR